MQVMSFINPRDPSIKIIPIMENQMGKMENEMETVVIWGYIGFRVYK